MNALFVYGTLQLRYPLNPLATTLKKYVTKVEEGWTTGELYRITTYPGMIKGAGIVHGEILSLDNFEEIISVLDEYEEYNKVNPERSLYIRSKIQAENKAAEKISCWTYWYNAKVNLQNRILSGRFC